MIDLEGAKVLVVEDEYFIAADLVRAVRAAGGEPFGPAGSVEHARALLQEEEVDAAVLDLNLHGVLAYRFVTELSEQGLPCVIMSGYSPESMPDELRKLPSLEKPVDYERVVQSVGMQLRAKSP